MSDTGLHVRFPSASFVSFAEFEEYRRDMQPRMDARYLYERSLAITGETILRDGTCAPCLRPARFTARTARGETLADGRIVPNWREELTCDCEDRLSNRNRALLHFLASVAGLRTWSRVLLFGPPGPADRRVTAMAGGIARVPRLGLGRAAGAPEYRLAAADATFHLVVSSDYLHRVPPLPPALGELRRVLVPGGQFVFTVPFRALAAHTVSRLDGLPRVAGRLPTETGGEVHELGWDILSLLRAAGFTDARAHIYWSDELGYLGPFNMIVSAVA
jgi:SAM-dependent methyltransferase